MRNLKNFTKLVISSFSLCFGCHTIDSVIVSSLDGLCPDLRIDNVKYNDPRDLMEKILDKVIEKNPDSTGFAKLYVGTEDLTNIFLTGDQELLSVTLAFDPLELEFKIIRDCFCIKSGSKVYTTFEVSYETQLDKNLRYSVQKILDMEAVIAVRCGAQLKEVKFNKESMCLFMALEDLSREKLREKSKLEKIYGEKKGITLEEYYSQAPNVLPQLIEDERTIKRPFPNNTLTAEILAKFESTELSPEEFEVKMTSRNSLYFDAGTDKDGNRSLIYLAPRTNFQPSGKYTLEEMAEKFTISDHVFKTSRNSFDALTPEQSRVLLKLLIAIKNIPIAEETEEEKMLKQRISDLGLEQRLVISCARWIVCKLGNSTEERCANEKEQALRDEIRARASILEKSLVV